MSANLTHFGAGYFSRLLKVSFIFIFLLSAKYTFRLKDNWGLCHRTKSNSA